MDVLEELNQSGALWLGRHFVYTGGQHGPDFVRIEALLAKPVLLGKLCAELVVPFSNSGVEKVTACTDDRCKQLARFCAKSLGIEVGSGTQLHGRQTFVAEDVLTTGGSVIQLCRQAEAYGAQIVGVGVICNRGGITAERLGVPRLESLASIDLVAMDPEHCVLCTQGQPIVEDVGQGTRFRQEHPEYPGGYERVLTT